MKREKKIVVYDRNNKEDAETIRNAKDGGVYGIDNVETVKDLTVGGVDKSFFDAVGWLLNVWSEQAGNMRLLGGTEAESGTLGQEQMLQANASSTIDDMLYNIHSFSKEILQKTAWYVWHDPFIDMQVTKRIAGLVDIQVAYNDDAKEGDFWEYNIDVEPYSTTRMNPTIRMRRIMELVNGVILPTADLAMQQGDMLNVRQLVKTISRDLDLTDSEVESFYQSTILPPTGGTGPYAPTSGTVKKVGDQLGASGASRDLNSTQQQVRSGMRSSPPNKSEL